MAWIRHAKIRLRIFLTLKPMAMAMALISSPDLPWSQFRGPILRSFLQWPMMGSMALRRF